MAKTTKKSSELPEEKLGGGETKSKNADLIKRAFEIFNEIKDLCEEYEQIHHELSIDESLRVGGMIVSLYAPSIDVACGVITGSEVVTAGLVSQIKRKLDQKLSSPFSFLGL